MTEHAGPGPAPSLPHARRPVLRVVGGTAVTPPDPEEQARARAAAARAAHPSSGAGVPGFRRPEPGTAVLDAPPATEVSPVGREERLDSVPPLEGTGPHLVTGRAFLAAARPGDVLRVEVVDPADASAPLGPGCTAYLPVRTQGTVFCPLELCRALGADGQSRDGSFRLTVCPSGARDLPSVAHRHPFAETDEHWIVVGHSATAGAEEPAEAAADDERVFCLTAAMHRAVSAGVEFLEQDRGLDRPIAHAYLSATAEFAVTRLGDGTVGAHGRIRKADFR
jgi:acetamidase/formamidase